MPLWNSIRRWPWLALAALTALQTAFTFGTRALWFSDEVRYADAYAGLLRGHWLVLNLNGVAYPDKPPLYFWLLRAIDALTGIHDPAVFFVGTALSGLLVLYAVLLWAKALRLPDEAGPLAGLLLLTTLFFAGLLHYSRMDLLFTALIVASQAAFCAAFHPGDETARGRRASLALLLAALATLTKGPLGLLFPVLTTLLFLAWRGRAREFFRASLLPGLGVLLAVVFSWVVAAYFMEGPGFLRHIFYEQIFLRATKTFHHAEPWYFYCVALPPCWLPWTLAPLALPVHRLFSSAFWRGLVAARRQASPEADARAWLWINAVSGFLLLSLLSGKVVVYLLPQLAPLALLLALGLLDGGLPWRRLWTAAGLFFLVLAGVAAFGVRLLPPEIAAAVAADGTLPGTSAVAAGFAACGLGLLLLRGREAKLVMTALALLTALWVQPAAQTLSPALDAIMSPKPQALLLKTYAAQGYEPVSVDIYSGIYSYYFGGVIEELPALDKLREELPGRDLVLAIKKKKWDAWTDRPAGVTIVGEQWLAGQGYYVAVSRKDGAAPAVHNLPAAP
jgi:4-amino-4-deoxy-L-arabinose transferase and related glycosyltransferases of PMT family